MIINVGEAIRTASGVIAGLRYQLRQNSTQKPTNPSYVEILDGDPQLLQELAPKLSTTQKGIPILISFKESKEELERKLRKRGKTIYDLYAELKELLFAGYEKNEVICSAIAHSDTDNFHIHLYVLNSFAGMDKTIKLHYGKRARHLRVIEEYINLKYGIEAPKRDIAVSYTRKEELLRRLGKAKSYSRTALKEELNALIFELVAMGELRDARDIRDFIEHELGGKVRRHGKNYMTVEIAGVRIRLRGGIYDANFRGAYKTAGEIQARAEKDTQRRIEKLKKELIRYIRRRTQDIQKRYGKDRQELIARDREYDGRTQNRGTDRKMEIRTHRHSHRHSDRHSDRSDRNKHTEANTRILAGDTGKGRRDLHSPRPKTMIDAMYEEVKSMRKEAERLKDTIDLKRLMSFLQIPFYYSETERGEYILASVPWREDKNPSFIAHRKNGRWLWYDLARREGGSVIDFVAKFFSATKGRYIAFKEVLRYLMEKERMIQKTQIAGMELERNRDTTQRIELVDDPEMLKKVMKIWGLKRIPPWVNLGKRIYVKHKIRMNKDGEPEGYEIKAEDPMPVLVFGNRRFPLYWRAIFPERTQKGWISTNKPIHIQGSGKRLYVVEGFTDAMAIYQIDPKADIYVLGTVENARKVSADLLRQFPEVYVATDNDTAGERVYEQLKKIAPHCQRLRYEGKDPMEAWLNGKLSRSIPEIEGGSELCSSPEL
jgi:5S rRNA maturation endonuclease (ribonuclease M5)